MNVVQLIKNVFILLLLLFSSSCQERKREKNNDSVSKKNQELVIVSGKLDSLKSVEKDNNLKELLPQSYAEKMTFKSRKEYEKWRALNDIK